MYHILANCIHTHILQNCYPINCHICALQTIILQTIISVSCKLSCSLANCTITSCTLSSCKLSCSLANYHLFSAGLWSTKSSLGELPWTWKVSPRFGLTSIDLSTICMLLRILFLTPCVVTNCVESLSRCWSCSRSELGGNHYCHF